MASRLRKLTVDRVDLVPAGANPGAAIVVYKTEGQGVTLNSINTTGSFVYTTGTTVTKATKTEDGKAFPASDFAYVPDSNNPSSWKLRLTKVPGGGPDSGIVGAAVAALGSGGFRGRKVQIPAGDMAGVKAKVRAAWKKAHPDSKAADIPAVLKSRDVLIAMMKGGPVAVDRAELAEDVLKMVEEIEAERDLAKTKVTELEAKVAAGPPADPPTGIVKSELSAEVRKALEDAEAEAKAQVEKSAKLEERLAKIELEQKTAEFVAKAKDLGNVGSAEDLGTLLLAASESLPAEAYKKLEQTLKAANAQLEKGALFATLGNPGAEPTEAEDKIGKMAADLVAKGEATSLEVAKMQIMKAHPELKREYLDSQRNR